MPSIQGYIDPFPRIQVGKPLGKYAVFDKERTYKVPDVTMTGERSQAHLYNLSRRHWEHGVARKISARSVCSVPL